jgi:hypothetical protein
MKLLSIERYIGVYNNPWDDKGYSDEYLLNISDEELLRIIPAKTDDPSLYEGVILTGEQINRLMKFSEREIAVDFTKNNYVLQTNGNYEWSKKPN